MRRYQCIVLIVAIALSWKVSAYPHGASDQACGTMLPCHGYLPQDPATLPYHIDISATQIQGGQLLNVTLQKNSVNDPSFEGFLLRASPIENDDAIGQFTDHDTGLVRYLTCFNNAEGALTHVSPVLKDNVTAQWRAPYYNGSVVFLASVAYNFSVFWIKFQSSPIDISYLGPEPITSTTPAPVTVFDYNECGISKSCYGFPFQCVSSQNCMFLVSYYAIDTELYLNIVGNTPGYVAFGLSTDQTMDGDSILACKITGHVNASINVGHDNYIANNDPSYFTLYSATYSGGNLNCQVSRPAQTTVYAAQTEFGSVTTDLAANQYYLLISEGYLTDDQSTIIYHQNRQASTIAVDLLSTTYVIVD
ncbi:hypothetical protein CHUAL_009393 [Chamberlinius hualienensis]